MRKAFKYRIYPTKDQIRELETALETLRRLYNECLAQRIDAYQVEGKTLNLTQQSKWFTEAKKTNTWYQKVNRSSVTYTLTRLQRAYENFFGRVKRGEAKAGFPRFKSRDNFDSMEYQSGFKLGDRLTVQYVGNLKIKLHRPIEGAVKRLTIKREASQWYAVFSCDLGDVPIIPSSQPPIGIDLGLTSFYTTSEGHHEPNPRHLRDTLPDLRRLTRKISLREGKKDAKREYMKRGGSNRNKAKAKLRRLHAKVANKRKDHHHKTALKLVQSYGLIALEDLNIKSMVEDRGVKSQRLNRSISDAGWNGFMSILSSKAESAGVTVVKVDPKGTTQECSGCGKVVPKTLRDRKHDCPHCGLSLDRDENAARNILARGLTGRADPVGRNANR